MKSFIRQYQSLKLIVNSQLFQPKADVKREPLRGFTLIELLVVFALMGILASAGMVSFRSYNQNQIFQSSASDVVEMLSVSRSRSLSQVKPPQCGTNPLSGYRVDISGNQYTQRVVCGVNTYAMQAKTLPSGISFAAGTSSTVLFSSGTLAAQERIVISGFDKSKTITILTTGNISVN
jgi:prepilin-type N-terminal cleavage/methylation domain-containing protein